MPHMDGFRVKEVTFYFQVLLNYLTISINSVTLHFQRNLVSERFHSQELRFMAGAVLECLVSHKT